MQCGKHSVYYVCQDDPDKPLELWQFKVGESGSGRYPYSIRLWEHFGDRTNKYRMHSENVRDGKKCERIFIANIKLKGYKLVPGTKETFYVSKYNNDDVKFMNTFHEGVNEYRNNEIDEYIETKLHIDKLREKIGDIHKEATVENNNPLMPHDISPPEHKQNEEKKFKPENVIDLTHDDGDEKRFIIVDKIFTLTQVNEGIRLTYKNQQKLYEKKSSCGKFLRQLVKDKILSTDRNYEIDDIILMDLIRRVKPTVEFDYFNDIIEAYKIIIEHDPYERFINLLNPCNILIKGHIDIYLRKHRWMSLSFLPVILPCKLTTNCTSKKHTYPIDCFRVNDVFYEYSCAAYFPRCIDYHEDTLKFVLDLPKHKNYIDLYEKKRVPLDSKEAYHTYSRRLVEVYCTLVYDKKKLAGNDHKLPIVIRRAIPTMHVA